MDYREFTIEIFNITGIELGYYKEKQMKRRIDALIRKNGFELYIDYIAAIKDNKRLFDEFINYLTINVSEFYRNPEQWEILKKDIIPTLLEKTRTPVVWSSACSTGDEPYTLVMALNKFIPFSNIKVIASDMDRQAIDKAKAGAYSYKSLEKLPLGLCEKYFIKLDDRYIIKDEVKNCVEYRHLNLLKDKYPSSCDLIVCRNVLIYFTEDAKNMIYHKFQQALKPGGILFVGSTEQIIMANKFNLSPIRTFFYVKKGE